MIQALLRKVTGVMYDMTVGLLKEYKRTTIDLARIELASAYVRVIKLIRQECLISTLIIFGVIIFANAMLVVQVSILLFTPWSVPLRIFTALAFGVVCAVAPLLVVLRFFSQERWMRITRADEIIARAMEGNAFAGTNGDSAGAS